MQNDRVRPRRRGCHGDFTSAALTRVLDRLGFYRPSFGSARIANVDAPWAMGPAGRSRVYAQFTTCTQTCLRRTTEVYRALGTLLAGRVP